MFRDYQELYAELTSNGLKYDASLTKVAMLAKDKKARFQYLLDVLDNEEAPASVLILALRELLGKESQLWDPDVIWYELERDHHLDMPLLNRDKILAAYALLETHSFYWDANTFVRTIMAFNDIGAELNYTQEPDPEHLCWGVAEANFILQNEGQSPESFNHEPQSFAAVVLKRNGFVLAPEPLEFSQEALDEMLNDSHGGPKKDLVEKGWKKLSGSGQSPHKTIAQDYPESPLGIHLYKLAECQAYLFDRTRAYHAALNALHESREIDGADSHL